MIAVREPADNLRRPPMGVVFPVVVPEAEVELTQVREPSQHGQHLVPEEEVHKARAVDPIRVQALVRGPHNNRDRC